MEAAFSKVDITPKSPMLLTGYGGNERIFDHCSQPIYARTAAFRGSRSEKVSVIVGVDLCGLSVDSIRRVEAAAFNRRGITPDRLVINSSHNHSAPTVSGCLDLYYEHTDTLDRSIAGYTAFVESAIIRSIEEAVDHTEPVNGSFYYGLCGFGVNRRRSRPELRHCPGPVDHDVPVLTIRRPNKTLIGLIYGYACHTTTLCGKDLNGDYPGWTSAALEERNPEAVALFVAGCGGDINPLPRYTMARSKAYGFLLAEAVEEAIAKEKPEPVNNPPSTSMTRLNLPLQASPHLEAWERQHEEASHPFDRKNIAHQIELYQKQNTSTEVPFTVRRWNFGDSLTWIFLSGEMVVDYSLKLKEIYGCRQTWVTAYCDELTPYIPSERVLAEGGYEGGTCMTEYGYPSPFATGLEARILEAVEKTEAIQ